MTDNANNGNHKSRLILAPYPWPVQPERLPASQAGENGGPFFYLSWAGWELYLRRRLGFGPIAPDGPQPILLPGLQDPERDFLALDQLIVKASQLGSGVLSLRDGPAEGLHALVSGIRDYSGRKKVAGENPILDDRSYLALWAVSELEALESERALAEAEAKQKAMWAALKGEDCDEDNRPSEDTRPARSANDSRALYAWKCWSRLAGYILQDSDQIVPTLPQPEEYFG